VWSGAVGAGVALGPVVGGALLGHFWWGSVFLVNVPVVLLGVAGVLLVVPESRDPAPGRPDVAGGLLSIAGLGALVYGIIDGGEHGFGRPVVWAACGTGVAVLCAFIVWESRAAHPSLDVTLFRNPRFTAAALAVAVVFFAALGAFFFVPFYLQLVRGYSPLETGLLLLPFAVAQLIFAPLSATMVHRYGAKAVCAAGLTLTTIAFAAIVFLTVDTPVWAVLVIFFVQGAGMANVSPPAMESVVSTLPRERAGVGGAVVNTVRQVSGALGIAVLGAIVAAAFRGYLDPALVALPEPVRAAAAESIAGSHAVAAGLGDAGAGLVEAANRGFVSALRWSAAASALLSLAGIAAVLRWLPGRDARG
jgi:MFS family permease